MTAGLSSSSTITVSLVGFFAFLVLVVLARAVMRRDAAPYRRYRMGIFVERDQGDNEGNDADS